jgi:uracil-DNA glycosylase
MKPEDEPYALESLAERQRRLAMLSQPHIEPLAKYLARIKAEHAEKDLPCFDPCDGGVLAKALFLLEAPGPKAVDSTFISRNNPDPTARNLCGLLQEAGVSRSDTLVWNIVPWYVGDGNRIRAVGKHDIQQSFPYVKDLLGLLPYLKVIILLGKKAQSARRQICQLTDLPIIDTHHPSARVFNVWPHKKHEVQEQLLQVAAMINKGDSS